MLRTIRNVRIVNASGLVNDTHVYDAATGEEISGVSEIQFVVNAEQGLTTTEISLYGTEIEVSGKATFLMMCPQEGVMKAVRSVTYEDGTTITFGDDDGQETQAAKE